MLCKCIYLIVNELAKYNHQNGNIEVCYTQYDETTNKSVKTIGFATSFDSYPRIYNKVRRLSNPNPYFNAKFFRNSQSQIIAEHGADDVSICLECPSNLQKRDHKNK